MNNLTIIPKRLQSSYSKAQLKCFCDILGVPLQASEAKIKQAFYKKSLQHHPDKNPGNEDSEQIFSRINEAYQALIYDRRYGNTSSTSHDFTDRWKYKSRNEFRQWERMKPESQRSNASSAWRNVHSDEHVEARERFRAAGNKNSWYGRYYANLVEEDFAKHRRKRAEAAPPTSDNGCRIM